MNATAAVTPAPRHGSRKILWLVLAMFALPMVIGGALFVVGWRPAASGSYGDIVAGQPALPLAELRTADGQPLPTGALAGRWTLMVATPTACSAVCRDQLDLVRRMHVALYKNMPRVRRLLLEPAPGDDPSLAAIRAAWPDLVIAGSRDPHWRALLDAIPPGQTRILVLDPEGRPVLRYPEALDARRALRDLERLLKLSWIG